MQAVETYPEVVSSLPQYSESFAMEAIRRNISVFRFIANKTDAIAMLAIQKDGMMLEYVDEQSPELCMAAYEQNPESIRFFNF